MGGLGNGRRGGRSPPLMIAALIACILVLGFNYWVSSSRNLELQTKLYELEGQVRRGVAERGAAEIKRNEFEVEIQKQKVQINHIESVYQRKLEESQDTCSQVKATLQQNISSSTKTIQELKGQLNQLNDDLGKIQKELLGCQANVNTLNNKLAYDMTHCNAQVLAQKELCDERVAAAKLEVQKEMEKLIPPALPPLENTLDAAGKGDVPDKSHTATPVESHTLSISESKDKPPPELLSNDIIVGKELPPTKDLSKAVSQSVPSAAAVRQDTLQPPEGVVKQNEGETEARKPENNLTEDKEIEVMDAHEEAARTEDPGMEGMLIGQGKADETLDDQKPEEPEEYDGDEQVVGGVDLQKQQQTKRAENMDKDLKQEIADYNGDDENEGEYEADKQAELAQI